MNPTTEQKYINKIRELEKRVEKLEQHTNECICRDSVHVDDMDVLDKIKGYVDHIRNTGMGKKKSLEFIEKYIEGLKAGK